MAIRKRKKQQKLLPAPKEEPMPRVEEKISIGKKYIVRQLPSGHRLVGNRPDVKEEPKKAFTLPKKKATAKGKTTALATVPEQKRKTRTEVATRGEKGVAKAKGKAKAEEKEEPKTIDATWQEIFEEKPEPVPITSVKKKRKKQVVVTVPKPRAKGEEVGREPRQPKTKKEGGLLGALGYEPRSETVTHLDAQGNIVGEGEVPISRQEPARARTKTKTKTKTKKKSKVVEEVTPSVIMARERKKRKAEKVKEQPRGAKGRFGKKPVSDYDLSSQDFYAKQYGKLQRGEISAETYDRYRRKYEEKHPDRKFVDGDRYQLTIQVTGTKDGEQVQWRIITTANKTTLSSKREQELLENLKEMYGDYIKIQSVRVYAVYDRYYRANGGAARLAWRP